jgi:hypothetical protein
MHTGGEKCVKCVGLETGRRRNHFGDLHVDEI